MLDQENLSGNSNITRRSLIFGLGSTIAAMGSSQYFAQGVEAADPNTRVLTPEMMTGYYTEILGLVEQLDYHSIKSHKDLYRPQFQEIIKYGIGSFILKIPLLFNRCSKNK